MRCWSTNGSHAKIYGGDRTAAFKHPRARFFNNQATRCFNGRSTVSWVRGRWLKGSWWVLRWRGRYFKPGTNWPRSSESRACKPFLKWKEWDCNPDDWQHHNACCYKCYWRLCRIANLNINTSLGVSLVWGFIYIWWKYIVDAIYLVRIYICL